jgi:superkiller protein 3
LLAPKETAKDYYTKGLHAQAASNNKEAIRYFTKAIELDKEYTAAYNSLGISYEKEFMPEKAEEMYLKAVSLDPYFSPAYSNLALLNEDRLDYAKALGYWKKRVLYGDPDDDWTKQALQRIKELSR